LNVSYDPTRELYGEINAEFSAHWEKPPGQSVRIRQSHGGAGKQARAGIAGREAGGVTLATAFAPAGRPERAGRPPTAWRAPRPGGSTGRSTASFPLIGRRRPARASASVNRTAGRANRRAP